MLQKQKNTLLVIKKTSDLKIMIKYAFPLIVVCLYVACQQPVKQNTGAIITPSSADTSNKKTVATDKVITPGGGIGLITIGENADSTISVLGKPDKSDAGMGAQMLTWYANHDSTGHQTNVYAHRNMGDKDAGISHVRAIRITSPAFNTFEQVHTGMPFSEIKKHFQPYHKTTQTPDGFTTYEDSKAGIAFEMNSQNTCSAIIVFARGSSLGTNLSLRQ